MSSPACAKGAVKPPLKAPPNSIPPIEISSSSFGQPTILNGVGLDASWFGETLAELVVLDGDREVMERLRLRPISRNESKRLGKEHFCVKLINSAMRWDGRLRLGDWRG